MYFLFIFLRVHFFSVFVIFSAVLSEYFASSVLLFSINCSLSISFYSLLKSVMYFEHSFHFSLQVLLCLLFIPKLILLLLVHFICYLVTIFCYLVIFSLCGYGILSCFISSYNFYLYNRSFFTVIIASLI